LLRAPPVFLVGIEQPGRKDIECVGARSCRFERALERFRPGHLQHLNRNSATAARFFCRRNPAPRRVRIPQDRNPPDLRQGFEEEFEAFCAEFDVEKRQASDVSAWVGKAIDDARRDGIADRRKHDRYRRRRVAHGAHEERRRRYDHVRFQAHELGRKRREAFRSSTGRTVDEGDVLALEVAEVAHAAAEGIEMVGKSRIEDPDLGERGRVLTARRDRPY
jgi:hypothetical protein